VELDGYDGDDGGGGGDGGGCDEMQKEADGSRSLIPGLGSPL